MEQPKRRKIAKAAAGIFTLALSFFFLTVAFYMDLMSITETERLQSQSEIFDPAKEADGRLKELTIQGLSYEFAKDFKGTDWYCFGFSETGQIRIIVLNEDHFRALEDHTAYLFSDSPSGLPDPDVLFGMAVPLEEDIRQFGLEALRYLLAQPDMTEEEFSAVVGTSVLDTTRLPAATEFFGIGTFLLAAAFVLFSSGLSALANACGGRGPCWDSILKDSISKDSISKDDILKDGIPRDGIPKDASSGNRFPHRSPSFPKGILGAALGSLIGVCIWLLLGSFGIISGIAGPLLLSFTFIGFRWLSGTINKKGIVFGILWSALIMALAEFLNCGAAFCRVFLEYDPSPDTVGYVASNLFGLMTESGAWTDYFRNLAVGYVFSAVICQKLVRKIFAQNPSEDRTLSEEEKPDKKEETYGA